MPSQKYALLDGSPEDSRLRTGYNARPWRTIFISAACFCSFLFAYHLLRPLTDEEVRLECREKIGPRRVHVVLPASTSSPRFCRSISTMLIQDYEPVLINWGGESHHSSKIYKLLEYLETKTSANLEHSIELPSQCADERADLIISMDAYDVFTQRPLDGVLTQFDKIPEKIVYSAEKGCHPPEEAWCTQIPDSPLPHNFYGPETDIGHLKYSRARFLNSGFVIGYAKDLLTLYRDAAAEATRRQGTFKADQSIFGPLYASGKYNLTLDYLSVMSSPQFFFEEEIGLQPTPADEPVQKNRFLKDEILWNIFNHVTGQFPAFVHYNGDKKHMDDAWRRTLWGGGQGRPVMDRINEYLTNNVSVPLDTGASIPFSEMCPGSWQIP